MDSSFKPGIVFGTWRVFFFFRLAFWSLVLTFFPRSFHLWNMSIQIARPLLLLLPSYIRTQPDKEKKERFIFVLFNFVAVPYNVTYKF